MASVSQAGSRRMYSWWWDSHISPKNSKWLQENLTDMDSKVKQMIKVIEEDADSFARRAEMYYKKRPELMKLVEEFYRAYRALAERYDHATGVIRQAHHTMTVAFPNQVPLMLSDESPGFVADPDAHTPDIPHPGRAFFDPGEQQKESFRKRNGGFSDDADSVTSKKGFGSGEKFADGRARKGLNFQAVEDRDQSNGRNGSRDLQAQASSDSDRMGKAEAEILNLKNALARLESEKEAGLRQYEQSLERLSNLESEVSRAQSDSKDLNERASTAEAEVQNLKGALAKLQAEREASLLQYQQLMDNISNLESCVSSAQKNAQNAETEAEALKEDIERMQVEKDVALVQYKQSLEMISNLQGKLVQAEEDTRQINERADKSERELEALKLAFAKLNDEKEAAVVQYMQCLETISNLESKLARAQEEAERLNAEINDGVAKLKGAEEKCVALANSNQTLQLELQSLVHKVGSQSNELTEKQKELGRLWTCVQEERLRFVEAETAFQTLQHLHSQSQEELRSLVSELQIRTETLNDMKSRKLGLEDEVRSIKEENKSLNEVNLSSAVSMKNLQEDIFSLRETIKRLEAEVELRVDQRNALQQEIYCLKEELNELSKKNRSMLEQVESVGYGPESFGSCVKELQDEKMKLNRQCETSQIEKVALLEQLKIMEKLMEKNILLENSLADLNDELEGVREKVKVLEESCQILMEEKSNLVAEKTGLISQLQVTNESLEKLSEKNNMLENSLFDANTELEGLREKSKNLEDSCMLLYGEKSGLVTERESLVSQLSFTRERLEDLGTQYESLDVKHSALEKDRENLMRAVKDLSFQLDAEKKQHEEFCRLSKIQLASRESRIRHLEEEGAYKKKEFVEEQDKALNAEIEILILLKCIQGLEAKNFALYTEKQTLLDESVKSKKLISEMEQESTGQKEDNILLSQHNNVLKVGLHQLLQVLDINEHNGFSNTAERDQGLLNLLILRLKETQASFFASLDEMQRLAVENSVLVASLEQVESDGFDLMTEKNNTDREFRIQSEQLSALNVVTRELCQSNEDLKIKLSEGDLRENELASKTEDLHGKLVDLKSANEILQKDNIKLLEEKRTLTLTVSHLEKQRSCLEEENSAVIGETMFHSNMSLVFSHVVSKNLVELAELNEKLNKLHLNNMDLGEKARVLEEKLEGLQMEKVQLKEVLDKSDSELCMVKSASDRLQSDICDSKNLLLQKEKEIEMWEGQADTFFSELQISNVNEVLLKGKMSETFEKYASLEDESNSKGLEIGLLKQKFGEMEDANEGLQAQLASYTLAVISLKNCITSLEKQTVHKEPSKFEYEDTVHTEPSKLEYDDLEDAHLTAQEVSQTGHVQTPTLLNGILELQNLQRRIEAIEIAVTEKEKAALMENLASGTKLDAAMREIEDLKARSSSSRENGQTSRHFEGQEELLGNGLSKSLRVRTRRTKTQEISELSNEVLTKDIVLDKISSGCISHRRSKSKIEMADGESHMVELWETVDHNGSIDLTVEKAQKSASGSAKAHRSKNPSVESLIEKELGVDKLELSRRFSEPRQEGNKRRVLERLDSDAQKLSNLQITVQDLKRKVDITEKSKKGKGAEYESVKGQLEETDEAISKLFDSNRRLAKNCEDGSSQSYDGISAAASLEESGSVRRRKVSEQARRGSEKIGRLQLEVQRLQFLLLKLDGEEKESRGRFRVTEQKSRVLLRDYLYGGTVRTARKYKKTNFCSCVQPPTRGD